MRQTLRLAALAGLAACISIEKDVGTPTSPGGGAPTRLQLRAPATATVGDRISVEAVAFDAQGNAVQSAAAVMSSPDSAQAYVFSTFQRINTVGVLDSFVELLVARPGTAWVHATMGSLRDSVAIAVTDLLPMANAAALVEFAMVEDRTAICTAECTRVAYLPILRLRETTGTASMTVTGADFTVPSLVTGLCATNVKVPAGATADVVRLEPTLAANGILLQSVSGPVPDGYATARVLIESAAGNRGWLFVTGPILRNSSLTIIPGREQSVDAQPGWTCGAP